MYLDTFKDLKRGDIVKFEDVYIHDKLTVSGYGDIYGFGRFSFTDLVWITQENGEMIAAPYEKVTKL